MKAYIATSLSRLKDQQDLAEALKGLGVSLSFDWTRDGTLAGRPHDEVSQDEIMGVAEADFLVVLLPAKRGTHVELGAALMAGKPVFIHVPDDAALLGGDSYTCVFYSHPLVRLVRGTYTDLLLAIAEDLPK
jgi:hypothetical protein